MKVVPGSFRGMYMSLSPMPIFRNVRFAGSFSPVSGISETPSSTVPVPLGVISYVFYSFVVFVLVSFFSYIPAVIEVLNLRSYLSMITSRIIAVETTPYPSRLRIGGNVILAAPFSEESSWMSNNYF